MRLERFEPRDGGSYRYIHKDSDGNEYAIRGVYHEVLKPERIIHTVEDEELPEKGHVSLITIKFEALLGERTNVTTQAVFQSVADRDEMIQSGMEMGVYEGHDRLDELLDTMKSRM
jgi:uncharacterized protein YndB with AHSA1/START domain